MRSIESRFVIGSSNILFGSVYGYAFEPGHFTGLGNEGVNETSGVFMLVTV